MTGVIDKQEKVYYLVKMKFGSQTANINCRLALGEQGGHQITSASLCYNNLFNVVMCMCSRRFNELRNNTKKE